MIDIGRDFDEECFLGLHIDGVGKWVKRSGKGREFHVFKGVEKLNSLKQ